MAWVAVDSDGAETIFNLKPNWDETTGQWICSGEGYIELPEGMILKMTGQALNWSNEPFEIS